MDLQTTLLSALSTYGVVAIFVAILISSIGLPLPTSFLLIVAGSFVQAGEMDFWPVVLSAMAGAIIGDHVGYALGRYGGRALTQRISHRMNADALMVRAEETSAKWGGISVFLSRWLITAIGPYINLISGITQQRLTLFAPCVILGEVLWVLAYVYVGRLFSDKIGEVSDALGDFSGLLLAIAAVCILGYLLWKNLRQRAKVATV